MRERLRLLLVLAGLADCLRVLWHQAQAWRLEREYQRLCADEARQGWCL